MINEIEKQYKDDMYIRISLKYLIKDNDRKYILNFSYFRKEKNNDIVYEYIQPRDSRNFILPIEYVGRYSKKRFEKYCNQLQKNRDELLALYENAINGESFYYDEFIKVLNK